MQTCAIICLGRPWTPGTLWQRWPTWTSRFSRRERSAWCRSKSFILLVSIFYSLLFYVCLTVERNNGKWNIENIFTGQCWNVLPEVRRNPGWTCKIEQAYLWHLCKHLNHYFTCFNALWANGTTIGNRLLFFLGFVFPLNSNLFHVLFTK